MFCPGIILTLQASPPLPSPPFPPPPRFCIWPFLFLFVITAMTVTFFCVYHSVSVNDNMILSIWTVHWVDSPELPDCPQQSGICLVCCAGGC